MCRNERVFPHTGAVVCFCGGDGGRAKRENAVAPFRRNGGARRGIRRADAAGARTVYGRTENHPRVFVCNGLFLWLCDPCRFRDTCVQRACQSCKNLQRPAVCGRGRVFGAARGRRGKGKRPCSVVACDRHDRLGRAGNGAETAAAVRLCGANGRIFADGVFACGRGFGACRRGGKTARTCRTAAGKAHAEKARVSFCGSRRRGDGRCQHGKHPACGNFAEHRGVSRDERGRHFGVACGGGAVSEGTADKKGAVAACFGIAAVVLFSLPL